MNLREKQCQPKPTLRISQRNTEIKFTRFTVVLSLSATLGLCIPAVQAADDRFTWTGPSGNWTDATKWTPESGVSGGIPNNGNGMTFDATMVSTGFPGSTVTLKSPNITIDAFDFQSGTITGPGNLGVNKMFTWDRGTMSGIGTTRADGGLELRGNVKTIRDNRSLVIGSGTTGNWTSGDLTLTDSNSRLVNEAAATFNLKANGAGLLGKGLFDNAGKVQLQLSDPSQVMRIANPRFNNSGTVNVQTGLLRIGGGGTSTGSFSAGPDGRINFSGGITNLQENSSVTGSIIDFSRRDGFSGETNVNGNYIVDETNITGKVNFNANNSKTGTLNLNGGDLSGSGILTVEEQARWTAGTQSGTGMTRLNGGLAITGNSSKGIGGDRNIVLSGGQTATWNAGDINVTGNPRITIEQGATFDVRAAGNAIRPLGPTGADSRIDNKGIIDANLANPAQQATINMRLDNSGLVNARSGELRLGGGGTSTGRFVAHENGTINFSGGTHNLGANSSVTGTKVKVSLSGSTSLGVVNVGGEYIVGETELGIGGTANYNVTDPAKSAQTNTLTMTGGKLGGVGNVSVSGKTKFTSGEMNGTGVTFANGGVEFDGQFMDISEGRVLVTGEESNWTSGNIRLQNPESLLFNAAVFNISADGRFMVGMGTLANAGLLNVDISDDEQVTIKSNVVNLGTIDLKGDTLVIGSAPDPTDPTTTFNGNFTNQGIVLFDIGGTISGEEFDVLSVFESAFLGGIFDITLVDGFIPEAGMTFDLLTVTMGAIQLLDGFGLGGPDGDKFIFEIAELLEGGQALRVIAAVPIPAAVWLFGTALFGLFGIGARRSK